MLSNMWAARLKDKCVYISQFWLFHILFTVTMKRIDLSGNLISEIEDGAFSKLTQLEELSLAGNKLVKLPMLPTKLMSLNVNHNQLKTKGVKANAFKVTLKKDIFWKVYFQNFLWLMSMFGFRNSASWVTSTLEIMSWKLFRPCLKACV